MRILHIIGTVDPRSGGPAAAIASLSRYSDPETYNEVVTLDAPDAPFLRSIEFPVTALGPAHTRYGFSASLLPWLRANGARFDTVVVHGLWQYCGFAARRAFAGRKPYMVFVHGMLDPYFKRAFPFKHLKKWIYWLLVEYWVLRGARHVLFTCDEEERLARKSFWIHSWAGHVVSLGASLPAGDPETHRRAFLVRFGALQNRRFLLFLGRIDRKKGCDLLIAAFIRAAALDPSLDLVMAGPDERSWRVELERAVASSGLASRVHWTGMLQRDEKWGAFLCSEVFILPSHQENFGIAVAEALASGRPVLLSDKVNIAGSIAAANAGLVEPDSEEGTFQLISKWIAMTPDRRRAMSIAALKVFETRYDMRNLSRQIADLAMDFTQPASAEQPSTASSALK